MLTISFMAIISTFFLQTFSLVTIDYIFEFKKNIGWVLKIGGKSSIIQKVKFFKQQNGGAIYEN